MFGKAVAEIHSGLFLLLFVVFFVGGIDLLDLQQYVLDCSVRRGEIIRRGRVQTTFRPTTPDYR